MRKSYGKCLLAVVLTYALVYGGLLLWSRGLPYVLDNNESFSSLWHAYNLYHFDVRKSCGLADEACSPHAEAHPYVHTHQGNFPRLFAFLLFVLGARTAESQIVLTTLTVGVATILFAYHFFSGLAGPRFALVACLFLMTDYLLFAQWQMVTYRVWHGFFVFSSLLCVRGAGGGRRGLWAALTLVNYLCLYYFEFVFVVFVTLTAALYAATLYGRNLRVVARAALPAAAGAVASLMIFFGQLAGYVGVRGLVQDALMTLHARNAAGPSGSASRALSDFYDRHAIIFWPNYFDARQYRSVDAAWRSFLTWNLGPYTPLLALAALLLLVGLLAGLLLSGPRLAALEELRRRLRPLTRPPRPRRSEVRFLLNLAAFLFLALCWDRFLTALVWGAAPSAPALPAGLVHVAAVGLCLLAGRWATNRWWGFARLPPPRVAAAGSALLAGALFLRHQHSWFEYYCEPLWEAMRRGVAGTVLAPAAVACAAVVAVVLALRARRLLGRDDFRRLGALTRYLACGAAAYLAVYVLFPGYLHTGYLCRFLSFAVFFTDAALAAAFFFLLRPLYREVGRLRHTPWRLRAALAPALVLGLAALFLAAGWVRVQAWYVRAMPPDQYAFLKRLAKPPYRGASFVTNVYALPVAASTGEWAYKDDLVASGAVQLGPNGYLVARDPHTYLWLADRAANPAYARPDYILLVHRPMLPLASAAQPVPVPQEPALAEPVVASPSPYLHHRVVAQDPSGRGRWVILKADWDLPPYLVPGAEGDAHGAVSLDLQAESSGLVAHVGYRYAHQEGKPEAGTVVRLYAVGQDGKSRLLAEQLGQSIFRLPSLFSGNLQASVTPATATKRGPEFFSDSRRVGDAPSVRPPYLRPLPGRADGACVAASPVTGRRGDAVRLEYQFCQDEGEPEAGSVVRLYLEDPVGQLTLMKEAAGGKEVSVPTPLPARADPSLAFRVSVTPRTATGTGREFFCPEKIPVAAFARPFLVPGSGPDAPRVRVSVAGPTALALSYAYAHPFRARERGTVVRLYRLDERGSLALMREEKDVRLLLLPHGFRGKVRVSVTPSAGNFAGPEYFSDTVVIED